MSKILLMRALFRKGLLVRFSFRQTAPHQQRRQQEQVHYWRCLLDQLISCSCVSLVRSHSLMLSYLVDATCVRRASLPSPAFPAPPLEDSLGCGGATSSPSTPSPIHPPPPPPDLGAPESNFPVQVTMLNSIFCCCYFIEFTAR